MVPPTDPLFPGYAKENHLLDIHLGEPYNCAVTLLVHSMPYQGQYPLLLVSPYQDAPCAFPQTFLVKVYDPRYITRRYRESIPWSHQPETVAQHTIATVDLGEFDDSAMPDDDDPVACELYYQRFCAEDARRERTAYATLEHLQGNGIPRCFGSGHLSLQSRSVRPPVLLIEHISDAQTMEQLCKDRAALVQAMPSILPSAWRIFRECWEHGVEHNDVHFRNILATPAQHPTSIVLIDFSESFFREECEPGEWKRYLDHAYFGVKIPVARAAQVSRSEVERFVPADTRLESKSPR
ncbi:hypothetical protein BXZ70DRAFT_949422 [Cristinia sonorae]|uniref:Protein kinase domain-containing protein n=1 Tax=Cristinia sonorae TaxID=1940300 RepID=A0A8K0UJ43_9AGAR|nr:hypothetical protein BXZ70DRAFT_949422 [Cristinia sonorae]